MKSILLAGFGGQGILFAGKQLALAAMHANREVTWLPSYGPEMRGGTANCTVIIAEKEIGSPITPTPDILVALNLPSYKKFEKTVAEDGILICDSSLVNEKSEREDINKYYIPATQMANENDLKGLANVIALGLLIKVTGIFEFEQFFESMAKSIPESKKNLIELNRKALGLGYNYIENAQ